MNHKLLKGIIADLMKVPLQGHEMGGADVAGLPSKASAMKIEIHPGEDKPESPAEELAEGDDGDLGMKKKIPGGVFGDLKKHQHMKGK